MPQKNLLKQQQKIYQQKNPQASQQKIREHHKNRTQAKRETGVIFFPDAYCFDLCIWGQVNFIEIFKEHIFV